MVFLAHEVGAIGQSLTGTSGIEFPFRECVSCEIRISQCSSPHSHQGYSTVAYIGRSGIDLKVLKPAVPCTNKNERRKASLQFGTDLEMTRDTNEWMFGRPIITLVRSLKRPANMRIDIWISKGNIEERYALILQHSDQVHRFLQIRNHRIFSANSEPMIIWKWIGFRFSQAS